eukprot:406903_1
MFNIIDSHTIDLKWIYWIETKRKERSYNSGTYSFVLMEDTIKVEVEDITETVWKVYIKVVVILKVEKEVQTGNIVKVMVEATVDIMKFDGHIKRNKLKDYMGKMYDEKQKKIEVVYDEKYGARKALFYYLQSSVIYFYPSLQDIKLFPTNFFSINVFIAQ